MFGMCGSEGWLGRAITGTGGTGLVAHNSLAALTASPGTLPDPHLVSKDSLVTLTGVVSTQKGLTAHHIPAIFRLLANKYLLYTLRLCILPVEPLRIWLQVLDQTEMEQGL